MHSLKFLNNFQKHVLYGQPLAYYVFPSILLHSSYNLTLLKILLLNYQGFLSLFCFPDVVYVLEGDRMFYGVGKRLLASGILFLTDRLLSIFYRYLIRYIIWSFEVGAQKGHAGHYS